VAGPSRRRPEPRRPSRARRRSAAPPEPGPASPGPMRLEGLVTCPVLSGTARSRIEPNEPDRPPPSSIAWLRMTDPTDDTPNPVSNPDWPAGPEPEPEAEPAEASESAPAPAPASRHEPASGSLPSHDFVSRRRLPTAAAPTPTGLPSRPPPTPTLRPRRARPNRPRLPSRSRPAPDRNRGRRPPPGRRRSRGRPPRPRRPRPLTRRRPARPSLDDDEEVPTLVWYVLKVQSSREDTIRDALERRGQDPGAPALLRPDRRADREDHRDPQQQEADRRTENLPRPTSWSRWS